MRSFLHCPTGLEGRGAGDATFREDSKEGSEASCLLKAAQMQPTSGLRNQLPGSPVSGQDPLLSGSTSLILESDGQCKLRASEFTLTVTRILFLQAW